jgi:hypothetical protein
VRANVRIALGELDVGGGAGDRLMEADFAYNVAAWQPRVDYEVVGNSGELTVQQQGLGEGIPTTNVRNEWDLSLNDAVPVDLAVQMGGGLGNLDLDSLALRGLNLDVGAGATRVDLSGDWGQDVSAVVRGGAGQVTMLLPSRMGVRVNAGTRLGRINAEAFGRRAKPSSTTPTATRTPPWKSTSRAAPDRSTCRSFSKKAVSRTPPSSRAGPPRISRAAVRP